MSKILEGMARVVHAEFDVTTPYGHMSEEYRRGQENVMRSALLYLADNVSDEMALAAGKCRHGSNAGFEQEVIGSYRLAIAAALRQAAGGEG